MSIATLSTFTAAALGAAVALVEQDASPAPPAAPSGTAVTSARQWTVAPVGGVDSGQAAIEGEEPAADGTFPDPDGAAVVVSDGVAYPEIAPYAVVFAALVPEDAAGPCQP